MKFDQDLPLNLRYDFGKMNSTLGSVVPLAMFKQWMTRPPCTFTCKFFLCLLWQVKILTQKLGADVGLIDVGGKTPLHWAASSPEEDAARLVSLLIEIKPRYSEHQDQNVFYDLQVWVEDGDQLAGLRGPASSSLRSYRKHRRRGGSHHQVFSSDSSSPHNKYSGPLPACWTRWTTVCVPLYTGRPCLEDPLSLRCCSIEEPRYVVWISNWPRSSKVNVALVFKQSSFKNKLIN